MFSITATKSSTGTGAGTVIAKGHGKQRTTRWDHSLSTEANFGAAVGTLLNVLTDPLQQAKVKHPSGRQRIKVESLSDAGGKCRYSIDV